MSSITPPFDKLPRVPAKIITKLTGTVDKSISKLNQQVQKTIKDATKLPDNCKCDDPRVRRIKTQLTNIQSQITGIQNSVKQIQNIADTVKGIVSTAVAIKAGISAAQLLNPITAPVFIAQQLMAVQDTIIVNSLSSLNQFAAIPSSISSNLALVVPQLTEAINKLSQICNFDSGDASNTSGEIQPLNIAPAVIGKVKSLSMLIKDQNNSSNQQDLKVKLNSELATDFYNDVNVSDSDIEGRSEEIQIILDDIGASVQLQVQVQQELQKSILEAPSFVYQQNGIPTGSLGKPGDFYIDLETKNVYGPKLSFTDWGVTTATLGGNVSSNGSNNKDPDAVLAGSGSSDGSTEDNPTSLETDITLKDS